MATPKLLAVDFEVFGRVQGVFFRKYTQDEAKELGVRGWCMNTYHGTVAGQLEGPRDKIKAMKDWLQRTGSPSSRIEKAEFKNEKEIDDYSFKNFSIKH
ncbi:acylphosphatase-2-like isoform X2 [Eriocheir sinensis]|uniref:acylphosphatase-2-like isoform X2 n=1 Tax=Eriocheir sinensis TaxID=95602 RepID=UPI0021C5EC67|nr:acylphosphatase-2-like isoform X2 [Eriocheir sinensis]